MNSDILNKVDQVFNETFTNKIVDFFKKEIENRKEALKGSGLEVGYYLSDSNMQEVFLKTYAKAYNKLYGFAKTYGIENETWQDDKGVSNENVS